MNTEITYMYRDAANYKNHAVVVLAGEITEEQREQIRSCLDSGEYFIPQQVDLPDAHFSEFAINEDDGPWHEMDPSSFEITTAAPTESITVSDLVAKFQNAKGKWNAYLWEGYRDDEEDDAAISSAFLYEEYNDGLAWGERHTRLFREHSDAVEYLINRVQSRFEETWETIISKWYDSETDTITEDYVSLMLDGGDTLFFSVTELPLN